MGPAQQLSSMAAWGTGPPAAAADLCLLRSERNAAPPPSSPIVATAVSRLSRRPHAPSQCLTCPAATHRLCEHHASVEMWGQCLSPPRAVQAREKAETTGLDTATACAHDVLLPRTLSAGEVPRTGAARTPASSVPGPPQRAQGLNQCDSDLAAETTPLRSLKGRTLAAVGGGGGGGGGRSSSIAAGLSLRLPRPVREGANAEAAAASVQQQQEFTRMICLPKGILARLLGLPDGEEPKLPMDALFRVSIAGVIQEDSAQQVGHRHVIWATSGSVG